MNRFSVLVLAVAACSSGPRPASRAPILPTEPVSSSVARGSCVIGDRLYTRDQELGFTALELETGVVAWSIQLDPSETLIHCDHEVILTSLRVGGRGLSIRARSPGDGAQTWQTSPRNVAPWADEVTANAWREKRGGHGVQWHARNVWGKGFPPSPEEEEELRREDKGSFRIVDGKVVEELAGRPKITSQPLSDHAWLSWDGRHTVRNDAASDATLIQRSGESQVVGRLPGLHLPYSQQLFVHEGRVLVLTATEKQDDQGATWVDFFAEVFDLQGNSVWSRRLAHDRVPEPVP